MEPRHLRCFLAVAEEHHFASAPYAIDIYKPVYGQAKPALRANTDTPEHQRTTELYVRDAGR